MQKHLSLYKIRVNTNICKPVADHTSFIGSLGELLFMVILFMIIRHINKYNNLKFEIEKQKNLWIPIDSRRGNGESYHDLGGSWSSDKLWRQWRCWSGKLSSQRFCFFSHCGVKKNTHSTPADTIWHHKHLVLILRWGKRTFWGWA